MAAHQKEIVQAINSLLREQRTTSTFLENHEEPTGSYIIRNLRQDKIILKRVRALLDETTMKKSLQGIKHLYFSDHKNSSSCSITFENPLDADSYFEVLAGVKDLLVSGKKLLVEIDYRQTYDSSPKRQDSVNWCSTQLDLFQEKPKYFPAHDAIFIENLDQVLESPVRLDTLQNLISVFSLFGSIDSVFLPISEVSEEKIQLQNIGFIGFTNNEATEESVLRCLYHLNNLTLKQVLSFSKEDINEFSLDSRESEPLNSENNGEACLSLCLCQRKHTPLLLGNELSKYVGILQANKPSIRVFEGFTYAEEFNQEILQRFSKNFNYQETNVYVNNLPVLFQNDDEAWHQFWDQFAPKGIKSAKIIKPQFYSSGSDSIWGKFGFVFYKDMRMAIRAILSTNKKAIKYKHWPAFRIEASFAIQKSSNVSSQQQIPKTSPVFTREHHRFSSPAIFGGGNSHMMIPQVPIYGSLGNNYIVGPPFPLLSGPLPYSEFNDDPFHIPGNMFFPNQARRFSDGSVIHNGINQNYGFYCYPYIPGPVMTTNSAHSFVRSEGLENEMME